MRRLVTTGLALLMLVVLAAIGHAQQPVGSRRDPAPVGTTLTVTAGGPAGTYTAKVTVLEALRGDAAWERVRAANPFNESAEDGYEYLIARIRFELVSMEDPDAALSVSPVDFTAVSAAGREYEPLITTVPPSPSIRATLYAGASHEGWAVFQVAVDDPAPVIAYGRDPLGRGGIWFATR